MTDIRGLGYLRVSTAHPDRWREFALDGLGFAEGSGPDPDALYLRMDEHRSRLTVLPGESDRVLSVGWQVRDQYALERVREAVAAHGTTVRALKPEETADRGFEDGIAFEDPAGTPVEVVHSPVLDHSPVVTRSGQRFVTGELGLGHVVLPTPRMEATVAFYAEVLGFLPRGAMRVGPPDAPPPVPRVRFMGCNPRHHSLAVCPAPQRNDPGLVHLMVEVESLDSVGIALDRVTKRGFSVSSTLGRHTNDKMVSFYVRAPGGWDIEYGTEGVLVDEDHYSAEEITRDSYWGHDWSGTEPLATFIPDA